MKCPLHTCFTITFSQKSYHKIAGPRRAIGRAPDWFDTRSGNIPSFIPSAFSRRAVVSSWRKYVHEVLVNHLGGLSLPRKSVVRLTDRPDMTLDVYCGRKRTIQHITKWILIFTEIANQDN